MKSFLILLALVAMCAAGAVREKRGFGHGYSVELGGNYGGYSGGYGGYHGGYSVPVVSYRHVVPVSIGYSSGYGGYGHGYGSGYGHGYGSGYGHGYGSGYGHGYRRVYGGHGGWW